MQTDLIAAIARGKVAMVSHQIPDALARGQLLVRAERSLISAGTELAKIDGQTAHRAGMGDDWSSNPLPLGYSLAGVVVAAGPDTGDFKKGDRVSANGFHAGLAVVDHRKAARIPDGVSSNAATFGTLGPTVLNAVRLARVRLGETCVVVGYGIVGQLASLLAMQNGCLFFDAVERRALRRDLGVSLGARHADPPDAPVVQERAAKMPGQGFDVVFEAAGGEESFNLSLKLAARGGRVIVLGSARGEVSGLNVYRDIHLKGTAVIGAHAATQPETQTIYSRWTEAANRSLTLELIASNRLAVAKLITDTLPAKEYAHAYELLRQKKSNAVILDWGA